MARKIAALLSVAASGAPGAGAAGLPGCPPGVSPAGSTEPADGPVMVASVLDDGSRFAPWLPHRLADLIRRYSIRRMPAPYRADFCCPKAAPEGAGGLSGLIFAGPQDNPADPSGHGVPRVEAGSCQVSNFYSMMVRMERWPPGTEVAVRFASRQGRGNPAQVRHYRRGDLAWRVAKVFDGPDPVGMSGDEVAPVARYWVLLEGALPYRPGTAGTFGAVLSRFPGDGQWWLTLPG
jgi:hypothetical protein